jgi:REP element-mobilizing transposase RayT
VLSRGNNKQCIFTDSVDYEKYLELLSGALQRFGVECHGFCVLWNHVHLLVTAREFPLSGAMQQVNSHYCQWFNQRHARVGHVLQGRYRCKLIEEGSHFLNAVRYVALNPVVAQKVATPADWPWSSYRAAVGLEPATVPLSLCRIWKDLDAENESDGRERLKLLVESGGHPDELWGPLIKGSAAFLRTLDPLLERHRGTHDFTYADRFATRPPLAVVLRGDDGREAKEDRVRVAFLRHAYTLREIGAHLQLHPTTVWRWVQRAQTRVK